VLDAKHKNVQMKLKVLTYTILLVFSIMAHAWIDRDGKIIADSNNRKSIGDFGAWLILVDDEKSFFKAWETPTPVVNIDTADKVQRNKPIILLVVFSGCKVDKYGNCSLVVDFTITQPDGTEYADIPNQPLWSNKTAPKKGMLVMGEAYLRIRIEPHEKLGTYKVHAIVKDLNDNKKISLASNFTSYDN